MLILDEPTRGIDVGAKYEIYTLINALADQGKGVLMISSEMPELLGMCDRIYVMNEGALVGELPAAEASQETHHAHDRQADRRRETQRWPSITDAAAAPVARRASSRHNFREYGMLLALVVIMAFFQVMTDGTLLKPLNLTNLFLQNSYIVIMALGMLLVIVAGHIDLSVGSVVRLHRRARRGADGAATTCRRRADDRSLCLVVGAAIGAAQGYWIAYWRIPSFIVTLAGMLVFRGLTLAHAAGPVGRAVPEGASRRSRSGFVPDVFGADGLQH